MGKRKNPDFNSYKVKCHSIEMNKLNDVIKANEGYTKKIAYSVNDYPQPDVNLDERVHGDGVGESAWFKKTVVESVITHTVTFSCTNGSVGATVDGTGIQSGAEVQQGKTVVFTITPDTGYEYTGTNPESVVVSADVTKSYECTAVVPSWAGLVVTVDVDAGSSWMIMLGGNNQATLQYSSDEGENWTTVAPGSTTMMSGPAVLWFRGNNPNGWNIPNLARANSWVIAPSGAGYNGVSVSGSIMSLIDGTGETTTIPAGSDFSSLFSGFYNLTSAAGLSLPATTLTPNCYNQMFYEKSTLTTVPLDLLPAQTLAYNCYAYMFGGCSALTSAPALPATTLAAKCYDYMFSGCSSLTSTPDLPAPTLVDYCYEGMFGSCSSLATVTCHATSISATESHGGWLDDVAASGTFNGHAAAGWQAGVDYPEGWTFVEINE